MKTVPCWRWGVAGMAAVTAISGEGKGQTPSCLRRPYRGAMCPAFHEPPSCPQQALRIERPSISLIAT